MNFEIAQARSDAWKNKGNVAVLRQWARELEMLNYCEWNAERWRMAGRFAMVVHPQKMNRLEMLRLVAEESNVEFLETDPDTFVATVMGDASYVIKRPTMIYVPQGEWSAHPDEGKSVSQEIATFHERAKEYLQGLSPSDKVVFVTVGDAYTEINPVLRSAGCIDRRFVIGRPALPQIGDHFIELIGRQKCDSTLLDYPEKVGKLIDEEFESERQQGLVALGMQRVAFRENRKLSYDDLVNFGVRGSGESDMVTEQDTRMLKRVAVHEAGHALMCVIDSGGINIPDYVSVIPGHQFRGISVDSYGYLGDIHGKYCYEDSRHKVRALLAGRVAESIVFGKTKVGTFGARSDLMTASSIAKELVGLCGFPVDIDEGGSFTSNLLVPDGEPTASEQAHIENQARKYLSNQYSYVEQILQVNRMLLVDLSERLMEKQVILHREVAELIAAINPSCMGTSDGIQPVG